VIAKLGGVCVGCGESDFRVLHINHRNGGGYREARSGYWGWKLIAAIAEGHRRIDDLDLRCANCNIRYEYERGRRVLPDFLSQPEVSGKHEAEAS
jgi:hypothetical protein